MRPDRVASALTSFVGDIMSEKYIEQPPFNIYETFG
jgi:dynein heavy chain